MTNQTIVITGASAGIGARTARLFAHSGWNVALIARDQARMDAQVSDMEPAARNATVAIACDVTDESAVDDTFAQITNRFGRIDCLFNNAGAFGPSGTIDTLSVQDWRTIVDVNLTGSFICARAAFRQMRQQTPQGGRIINNGSISAHAPRPGSAAYTSTKHAITGLTKTLALDGRPFSIACGQIDIGNALTEMTGAIAKGARQPDGSLRAEPVMDADQVAKAVLHMASLPLDANILSMTIMARDMPFVGRG